MSAQPPVDRSSLPEADKREVEWQLAAKDLARVGHWLAEHPSLDGWTVKPLPTVDLQDTYFDTPDWRIYRSGFALRVRDDSGTAEATLKELRSAREDVADRRELTEPLNEAGQEALLRLEGPVGKRMHTVIGTESLQPLFAARTSRRRFGLLGDDGTALGEIALDDTVISPPDGAPCASLQRVEVEAHVEDRRSLEKFVRTLRRQCDLAPAAESKYLSGLRSVGLSPLVGPKFGAAGVDREMRTDEVVLNALRQHYLGWLAHEPAARLGEDPESLHEMRVSGRRIHSILGLFAQYLPAALVSMRGRLKTLLQTLGKVRDLDVQRMALDRFAAELPQAQRAALGPLRKRLDSEHGAARAAMLRVLDRETTQRWSERLNLALMQPSTLRARRVRPPVTDTAPTVLRTRYRKFRKAAKRLDRSFSYDESHAVRGKLKKLRYAVEAVSEIYGKPAGQFLKALRHLQNSLGQQQDAYVAQQRLQDFALAATASLPTETVFLIGRIAERHAAAASRGREGFEEDRQGLHRKQWKRLRRKLERLEHHSESEEDSHAKPRTLRQGRQGQN